MIKKKVKVKSQEENCCCQWISSKRFTRTHIGISNDNESRARKESCRVVALVDRERNARFAGCRTRFPEISPSSCRHETRTSMLHCRHVHCVLSMSENPFLSPNKKTAENFNTISCNRGKMAGYMRIES